MNSYSKADIPIITLGIQLKTLSEDELRLALSFLDEGTKKLVIEILNKN